MLVPTTILALQHYRTFNERLKEFPVRIEHLSRLKSAKETRQILEEVKSGKIDILIGTHKILGKGIEFKDLGLLVIDEEQKFGVAAKEKLRQLRAEIDTLTLTATPIPRTLQFSLMGSRDLSVITTPPPNRQPIATETHPFDEEIIREAIEFELARGGQVYFVHNRVGTVADIEALVRRLCPQARTAVGHGRMNAQQMEKLMMDFIYGEFDVLIATSIIESGVDVPNAALMLIENAECFGLSQLHQLRGRVGRGRHKSYCVLVSDNKGEENKQRLKVMSSTSDGFAIAEEDLKLRGPGDFFGSRQHGLPSLRVADLSCDLSLLHETQSAAEQLLAADPALKNHPLLKARVELLFELNADAMN